MKTILVINDHTPGVISAAKLAFFIAQELKGNLVLADTYQHESSCCEKVPADDCEEISQETDLGDHLAALNERPNDFQPVIREMNIAGLDEKGLAQLVNQNEVWLIVKAAAVPGTPAGPGFLNFHKLLQRTRCPLMLVPENWRLKNPERLAYIADLRYCRAEVLHYLGRLAAIWHADVSIAHLSKDGLADLADTYAAELFEGAVRGRFDQVRVSFNKIRGQNLLRAADVLVGGMHNDLLVMAANRYHFNTLIGPGSGDDLPPHISVPILVFPS